MRAVNPRGHCCVRDLCRLAVCKSEKRHTILDLHFDEGSFSSSDRIEPRKQIELNQHWYWQVLTVTPFRI